MLRDPLEVKTAPQATPAETVSQSVFFVPKKEKKSLLVRLLREEATGRVIVFARTKHGADKLHRDLAKAGIDAAAIHGNKSQSQRERALEAFKSPRPPVLVATDIAARGLDIEELPQVVNYELPNVPEDYVHRIGRTGRAGASGRALSLVGSDERAFLQDIERLLKRRLPRETLADFDVVAASAAARAAGADRDDRDDDRPPRGGPRGGGRGDRSGRGDRGGRGVRDTSPAPAAARAPQGGGRPAQGAGRGTPAGNGGSAEGSAARPGERRGGRGNPPRGAQSARGPQGPRSQPARSGVEPVRRPVEAAPQAAGSSPAAPSAGATGPAGNTGQSRGGFGAALISAITRPFGR
jgi:ATP-dependent RNA helicase RhlE